jgi:hypothetical protein
MSKEEMYLLLESEFGVDRCFLVGDPSEISLLSLGFWDGETERFVDRLKELDKTLELEPNKNLILGDLIDDDST